jgi:hypothetical protein
MAKDAQNNSLKVGDSVVFMANGMVVGKIAKLHDMLLKQGQPATVEITIILPLLGSLSMFAGFKVAEP